jgi:hypothetical protein
MSAGQTLKRTSLVVIRPVQGTLSEVLSSIGGDKGLVLATVLAGLDEIDLSFPCDGPRRDSFMTGIAIPVILHCYANPY